MGGNPSIEKLKSDFIIDHAIHPGQSSEVKKQTDEFLKYTEASTQIEIDTAKATADAQNKTTDEFKGVEANTHQGVFGSMFDKLKSTVDRVGSKTYDVLGMKSISEIQKTLTGVAVGAGIVGAGLWGVNKLRNRAFGDKEKKESDDTKKESKEGILKNIGGSIRGLVKKVALWGGGALAASYLASYLLKGRSLSDLIDDFLIWLGIKKKKDGDAGNSNAGNSGAVDHAEHNFEKEKQPIQQAYNEIGAEVNNFYGTSKIDTKYTLGDDKMKGLDQKIGVVPYMLDGRYKTLGDFIGEKGIFLESFDKDKGEIIDRFQKSFTDKPVAYVQSFFGGFAGLIDAATMGLINTQTTVSGVFDTLKSNPNYEVIVNYAYDKSMMTLSYLQNRREAVEKKLQAEGKSSYEIKRVIQDEFLSQKMCTFDQTSGELLGGFINYLKKNNLMIVKAEDIPQDLKEQIEKSDKEKESFLSRIDKAKKAKEENTLTNEEVQSLCDDLLDHCHDMADDMSKFTVLPILKLFHDEEMAKELYNQGSLKPLIEGYVKVLEDMRNKGNNCTLQELDNLTTKTTELFEEEQKLIQSSWYAEESRDANGDVKIKWMMRIKNTAGSLVDSTMEGFEMIINGKDRTDNVKGGLVLGGVGVSLYIIRYPHKAIPKAAKILYKSGLVLGKGASFTKGMMGYGSKAYYETTHGMKLAKHILSGKISQKRALALANELHLGGKGLSFGSFDDVVKHLIEKQGLTDDQIKFVINNIDEIQKDNTLAKSIFQNGDNMTSGLAKYKPSNWSLFADNTSLKVSKENLDELIRLNPTGKIVNTLKSSLDDIAKTLTGDTELLFSKTNNEIKALQSNIDNIMKNKSKWSVLAGSEVKTMTAEIKSLENLARKISVLPITEAKSLLLLSEKISIKSLSYLTHNIDDTAKLAKFLDEVAELADGGKNITSGLLRTKLVTLGETKVAKIFDNPKFATILVDEMKAINLERAAGRLLLTHIDDGIKVLSKLIKIF